MDNSAAASVSWLVLMERHVNRPWRCRESPFLDTAVRCRLRVVVEFPSPLFSEPFIGGRFRSAVRFRHPVLTEENRIRGGRCGLRGLRNVFGERPWSPVYADSGCSESTG